jgi:hypothetical protein
MSEPVRVYIERLKAECSVRTDEELGKLLGYSKQAIANWRRRESIPAALERKIVAELGPRFAINPTLRRLADKRMTIIVSAVVVKFWHEFLASLKDEPSPATLLSIAVVDDEIRAIAAGLVDTVWDEGTVQDMIYIISILMMRAVEGDSKSEGSFSPRLPAALAKIDLDGNEIIGK